MQCNNATVPTLTLDTNVMTAYWKNRQQAQVVEELLDLNQSGEVALAVTTRIHQDIPKPELSCRIKELPQLGISKLGSVARVGYSTVDGLDVVGNDLLPAFFKSLEDELRRRGRKKLPDWRDWDHIYGHGLHGRDVFLTWDRRILEVAPELKDILGIVVMKPEDYLSCRESLSK